MPDAQLYFLSDQYYIDFPDDKLMKNKVVLFLIALSLMVTSCISTKDVRYLQPNESLVINEEGLVSYNIPIYRVTKNDMLTLNLIWATLRDEH